MLYLGNGQFFVPMQQPYPSPPPLGFQPMTSAASADSPLPVTRNFISSSTAEHSNDSSTSGATPQPSQPSLPTASTLSTAPTTMAKADPGRTWSWNGAINTSRLPRPPGTSTKKSPQSPKKPRRFSNQFILYRADKTRQLRAQHGLDKFKWATVSRVVSVMWKRESKEVKDFYLRKSLAQKEQWKRLKKAEEQGGHAGDGVGDEEEPIDVDALDALPPANEATTPFIQSPDPTTPPAIASPSSPLQWSPDFTAFLDSLDEFEFATTPPPLTGRSAASASPDFIEHNPFDLQFGLFVAEAGSKLD
ncbi:hypothetical protein HK104_005311 [Borealophlyctis nickersoniae]|nr:hypothetical protein HK104_005311 [Borealophlyctis nickersoniae]